MTNTAAQVERENRGTVEFRDLLNAQRRLTEHLTTTLIQAADKIQADMEAKFETLAMTLSCDGDME